LTPRRARAKRLFDVATAAIGLTLLWPLLLLLAILVRRTTPGPAVFRHVRIGKGGSPFEILKLRTMYVTPPDSGPQVTIAGDTRITPLGQRLRRTKLDELPQLWNILKGEMSLVGPRPDVPGYADRLTGRAAMILDVRPGVTGPATLHLRREEDLLAAVGTDPERFYDRVLYPLKVQIDLDYIEHWSFLRDLGYVLVTVMPPLDRWLRLVPTADAIADFEARIERPEVPGV
jgi:lipopolysaccharide/colanic/teichoic acid biosynthesis glycosyltransferase